MSGFKKESNLAGRIRGKEMHYGKRENSVVVLVEENVLMYLQWLGFLKGFFRS